ncbi:MAG: hypothetical protein RLZZ342_670 [Candidatus Parcubacteria bacterium]|jgi:hypothetical protein
MLKPFVPEVVFLAIFVLGTRPEKLLLVQPRDSSSDEWILPSIQIDGFAAPEDGARSLLRELGINADGTRLSRIKDVRLSGEAIRSYRVNITPDEAARLSGTDDHHILIIPKNELKGIDGSGYLARSQRALLCP